MGVTQIGGLFEAFCRSQLFVHLKVNEHRNTDNSEKLWWDAFHSVS